MNSIKHTACIAALAAGLPFATYAQHDMGVATTDWSSMSSLYLNPAGIAATHERVTVYLASFGITADNSLGTFTSVSNIVHSLGGNYNTNIFNNSGASNFNMLVPAVEMRGPGLMIGIDDKQTIALTTGVHGFNQFNNFSQPLYESVTDPTNPNTPNYSYNSRNFNWTAQLWTDIGLTYARKVLDQGNSVLMAGVTLRYLGGIGYITVKGNNVDVQYYAKTDSFRATNSDIQYASNIVSANNAITKGLSTGALFDKFFGSKAGSGFGADLGLTYMFLTDDDDNSRKNNDYLFKAGISVTDIGSIKYPGGANYVINASGNGSLTGKGLADNAGNYSNFRNYMVRQGYTADTSSVAVKVHMPTALVLSGDYKITTHVYANATYIGNLVNRQDYGNSYYSQLTITPRYDSKILSVGLPITYSTLASDIKMGLGIRFGGFFAGSDDMLAIFSSNQRGFGFYIGGYVPIFKKKARSVSVEG